MKFASFDAHKQEIKYFENTLNETPRSPCKLHDLTTLLYVLRRKVLLAINFINISRWKHCTVLAQPHIFIFAFCHFNFNLLTFRSQAPFQLIKLHAIAKINSRFALEKYVNLFVIVWARDAMAGWLKCCCFIK